MSKDYDNENSPPPEFLQSLTSPSNHYHESNLPPKPLWKSLMRNPNQVKHLYTSKNNVVARLGVDLCGPSGMAQGGFVCTMLDLAMKDNDRCDSITVDYKQPSFVPNWYLVKATRNGNEAKAEMIRGNIVCAIGRSTRSTTRKSISSNTPISLDPPTGFELEYDVKDEASRPMWVSSLGSDGSGGSFPWKTLFGPERMSRYKSYVNTSPPQAMSVIHFGSDLADDENLLSQGVQFAYLDFMMIDMVINAHPSKGSAFTATLTVEYPMDVTTPCWLLGMASLIKMEGRKIWLEASFSTADGQNVAKATSLFIDASSSKM